MTAAAEFDFGVAAALFFQRTPVSTSPESGERRAYLSHHRHDPRREGREARPASIPITSLSLEIEERCNLRLA